MPELEIAQVVEEAVIVPLEGWKVTLPLTAKAPVKEKLAEGWVPGVPAMVKLKGLKVPLPAKVQAVPEAVTVPAVGAKSLPVLMVKTLAKEKLLVLSEGWLAGVPAMVVLAKLRVLLLTIVQPVDEAVTVFPEKARVIVLLTVKAPVKEKSAVSGVEGVVEAIRPAK